MKKPVDINNLYVQNQNTAHFHFLFIYSQEYCTIASARAWTT